VPCEWKPYKSIQYLLQRWTFLTKSLSLQSTLKHSVCKWQEHKQNKKDITFISITRNFITKFHPSFTPALGPPSHLYNENRIPFLVVMRPGRDIDYTPHLAMILKKEWSSISIAPPPSFGPGVRWNLALSLLSLHQSRRWGSPAWVIFRV